MEKLSQNVGMKSTDDCSIKEVQKEQIHVQK